jgi:hypothetical protein
VDACEAAVARHPILGAAVHEHEGLPWLGPAAARPDVAHVDLTTSPPHRVAPQLADLVMRETMRPFDLGRGPLARFTLCRAASQRFLLLVVAHAIIFDAESQDVLVRDLTCLYGAFSNGSPGSLPPLPPFREVSGTEPGGCVHLVVDAELDDALDEAGRALGATRLELLLAGLLALLHGCGNEDAVVGLGASTRGPVTRDCCAPPRPTRTPRRRRPPGAKWFGSVLERIDDAGGRRPYLGDVPGHQCCARLSSPRASSGA